MDILIAVLLALLVDEDISEIGRAALLPLAGIFIGVAISASSNAQSLLLSSEMQSLADRHEGGLEDFVYPFYLAILVIFFGMAYWGLAATGAFDSLSCSLKPWLGFLIVSAGFFIASLTIRLSWQVLRGVAYMIFAVKEARDITQEEDI